jgi:hypothetical protein
MASRAACQSATSPPVGREGRRQRRQNSRRRYRFMSTFLTCPGIDLIYERATLFSAASATTVSDIITTPPSVFFGRYRAAEATIIFWTRAEG